MRREGFTLLEVIIALAILAVALGVLVEVSRLSLENARMAALQTEAAIVAESVLAELEAGTAELTNFTGEWIVDEQTAAEWSYEVAVESAAMEGMLVARVLVTEVVPSDQDVSIIKPISFSLVRWFQDPYYLEQIESLSDSGG